MLAFAVYLLSIMTVRTSDGSGLAPDREQDSSLG